MALQLEEVLSNQATTPSNSLRTDTISPDSLCRRNFAITPKNIPPSQVDLARQVGVSDRTLQKGFKSVFGMTPFAYLTQQRMNRAEQLLRHSNRTVAEVVNRVGYANPAQFAVAFKRHDITPRECLRQRG